jgi:hypothetical protein
MRASMSFFAAAAMAAMASGATAETVAETKGRYTMTPVEGGFMRLDTETGSVALCTRKGETWTCEPVSDKAASPEDKTRLEAENKALKDRVRELEAAGPTDKTPDGPPGGVTKLPSEKEVDEALDYVERMYKKFRDRLQKIQPAPSLPKPGDGGSGAL